MKASYVIAGLVVFAVLPVAGSSFDLLTKEPQQEYIRVKDWNTIAKMDCDRMFKQIYDQVHAKNYTNIKPLIHAFDYKCARDGLPPLLEELITQ